MVRLGTYIRQKFCEVRNGLQNLHIFDKFLGL